MIYFKTVDDVLKVLERLPENVKDYVKLEIESVETYGGKGVCFRMKNGCKWFPVSQLRKDSSGNIWCPKWILEDRIKN